MRAGASHACPVNWTLAPNDSCSGLQFSPALSGGKTCVIAFLAILTTLEMILANQALDLRDDSRRSTGSSSSDSYYINTNRANTATAGEATHHLLHRKPHWARATRLTTHPRAAAAQLSPQSLSHAPAPVPQTLNPSHCLPAGWILLSIFNLLLIAAMSTHPEHHDEDDLNATTGKHGPPPAASHPMRPMSSRGGQSLGSPTIPTTSV